MVTSGSRFPAGLVVGTIVETAADEAGFGLATEVEPAVNFSRLDFVLVIVGYSPLDQPPEEDLLEEEMPAEELPGTETTEPGTRLPSQAQRRPRQLGAPHERT